MSKPVFFLEKERREGGERLGFARRSGFGWVCFPFLPPKGSSNLQEDIWRDKVRKIKPLLPLL